MSISATVVTGVVVGVVAGTVVGVVVLVAVLPVEVVEVSPFPVPLAAGVVGLAVFAALLLAPSPPPQALSAEIKAATKTDGIWFFIFMIHDRKGSGFWSRARIVPDKNWQVLQAGKQELLRFIFLHIGSGTPVLSRAGQQLIQQPASASPFWRGNGFFRRFSS